MVLLPPTVLFLEVHCDSPTPHYRAPGKSGKWRAGFSSQKQGGVGPGLNGLFTLGGDCAAETGLFFMKSQTPPFFRDRDNALIEWQKRT